MTEITSAGQFTDLLAVELQTLKRTARKVSYLAGQVIFQGGDIGDGVYVVDEGGVEISAVIRDADRRVLSRVGPGNFFGEMAVLDGLPRSATATAEVDTVVSFIPSEEMLKALAQSPQLMICLVREFSHRMRQFDRRFLEEIVQAEQLAVVGRFAQSIVHDFKNPLNMISLAADLASTEDASVEHRVEAGTMIRKQVDRLANMINELLEFTRGTSVTKDLHPLNYRAFIEETLREIGPEIADRSMHFNCENEPPDLVLALDRGRLLHVILNLVNNAIDFLPYGGKITMRFRVTDTDVVTEVEDNGPGISPEIAAKLFEPFATHGKAHGTGLGLSICRRIIEDHGGRIHARNAPGSGAVFSFTLPLPA